MASHTHMKKLVDELPVHQVPLFPDHVVRVMESGEVSERQLTAFEIRAVIRGLRQPERWKQRGDHYDSVCWWMGEREFQCQWFPAENYLLVSDRAPHTARACGWKPDEIVTFSHPPQKRSLSDVIAREKGIVTVHPVTHRDNRDGDAVNAYAVKQYKIALDVNGSLGAVARHVTQLVAWWLLEHFEIADRETSLFYDNRFLDMINKKCAETLLR